MRIRSLVAAHPLIVGSVLFVAVGLGVFGFAYFEPQKLFIDDRVDEGLPKVTGVEAAALAERLGKEGAARADRPALVTVARGRFESYEHATSGRARVLRLADGSRYLRFEEFETSNGPDVRVYLSAARVGAPGDSFDDDYVELGELKGNIGDQNYAIPASVGLGRLATVVIWCERFSVAFGAASLA